MLPESNDSWILHVLEPQPEGGIGGADLHVFELALAQKTRSSFKPLVLITRNYEYADRLEDAGISYIPGHICKNYPMLVYMLGKLPRAYNIRLIHSHGYDANYLTYLLRTIYPYTWGKIPTVMTCHGWLENSLFLRIKTWLDFLSYRTANALIVCSSENLARLSKFKNRLCIVYIPNGVFFPRKDDSSNNKQSLKEKYQIPRKARLVAAVGRLSAEKRLDIYLLACRKIARSLDDVHFLIVGSGSEREHLERLTETYGIRSKVIFTGLIVDIDNLYEELSLLILSSDIEGTPRVVLEAMVHALPVVATRAGDVDKLVIHGENGYLADRGDSDSLAKYAIYLLQNESKRVELGKNAQERVMQNFSILQMQERIEKIYKWMLNREGFKNEENTK